MKKTIPILCSLVIQIEAGNWKSVGLENEQVSSVAIHPDTNSIVYAGSHSDFSASTWGKIFKSIDGGITWDTLLYGIDVTNIVFHPKDSNTLYAALAAANASPPGIIKTTDGGQTWFKSDSGVRVNWETSVLPIAIDPIQPDILYAGTVGFFGGTIYKSVNNGVFWDDIRNEINDSNISTIEINKANPNVIYVGTTGANKIFKSINGGVNWSEMIVWEQAGGFYILALDPINTNNIYAGLYQKGILKSVDAGTTWVLINNGLNGKRVTSIVINPNDPREILAGTYEYGVFRSVNGGELWEELNDGLENKWVTSIAINPSGNELYCGTFEGIYKKTYSVAIFESPVINYYRLHKNHPNPFNATTTIRYELPTNSHVNLTIYDILGREVAVLGDRGQRAGVREVQWDASNVPSGVYFVQMLAGNFRQVRKVMVLK